MTDFNELIERIRKEKVTLFIGSGFSLKAGGPKSNVLVESILSHMKEEEKSSLSGHQLDYVAEEYEQLYGRDSLLEIIEKEMGFYRIDMTDHECLPLIPHFHRIITTNYDTLLEDAYGTNNCYVVRNTKDCVNLPTDKTQIFKIHGDFVERDNIIITKDDYTDFFTHKCNPLLWDLIQTELLTKDILFIGYSLEDCNVFEIIKKLKRETNGKTRKFYLIAPGLKEYKINRLAQANVIYYDAVASDLFDVLIECLNKNIKRDYQRKWISTATFSSYCRIHNLFPIVSEKSNENIVERFDAPQGKNVAVHFSTNSKEVYDSIFNRDTETFKDFIPNSKIPAYRLTMDKLTELSMEYNGVTVGYKDEISGLLITPAFTKKQFFINIPSINFYEPTTCDFYVKKKGEARYIIETDIYTLFIDLAIIEKNHSIAGVNVNVSFDFKETYSNSNEAIKWIEVPIALFGGSQVYIKGLFENSLDTSIIETNYDRFKEYYNNIKQIECLSGFKFLRYECCTEERYYTSRIVLSYLKKEALMEKTPKGSFWTFTVKDFSAMPDTLKDKKTAFVFGESIQILEPLYLNGKGFRIPYKNVMRGNCKIKSIKCNKDGSATIRVFDDEPQIYTVWSDNPIKENGNQLLLI